jgi:hypothetical protein
MSDSTSADAKTDEAPQEGGEPKTFDAEYVAKLRKEAAAARIEAKNNADAAKRLAEIEDANKSEVEKAAQRVADAEARAKAAETRALRLQVAAEKGLTVKQAGRLSGETLEELQADADDFLADLPNPKPTPGDKRPREASARVTGDDEPPVETDPAKLADAVMAQASF